MERNSYTKKKSHFVIRKIIYKKIICVCRSVIAWIVFEVYFYFLNIEDNQLIGPSGLFQHV